ncbi:MAG: hypothetical protein MZW92_49995 [Comamonadaceae bacterium]|nr:hypothetical protein [Comamonadaceae bacterium]
MTVVAAALRSSIVPGYLPKSMTGKLVDKWSISAVAAALVAAALPAAAGGRAYDAGVIARQQRQQERISPRLALRRPDRAARRSWLESEQRWIRRKENLYRSDGVLSEAERRQICGVTSTSPTATFTFECTTPNGVH